LINDDISVEKSGMGCQDSFPIFILPGFIPGDFEFLSFISMFLFSFFMIFGIPWILKSYTSLPSNHKVSPCLSLL